MCNVTLRAYRCSLYIALCVRAFVVDFVVAVVVVCQRCALGLIRSGVVHCTVFVSLFRSTFVFGFVVVVLVVVVCQSQNRVRYAKVKDVHMDA